MEPHSMDSLSTPTVEELKIKSNRVSSSSSVAYTNSITRFLLYIFEYFPQLLSIRFKEDAFNEDMTPTRLKKNVKMIAKQYMENQTSILDLDQITSPLITRWLLSIKDSNGQYLTMSSYSQHRSALSHLFRQYDRRVPDDTAHTMTDMFAGLKRTISMEVQDGNGSIKKGKDPMSFDLYQWMCEYNLKSGKSEGIFTQAFLVLSWNLMCRASNVESIHFNHMEWRADAYCVYFAHQKNDQGGEKPRDARHIYANPFNPAICPVLSLGIYLFSQGYNGNYGRLFPGGDQYERYRKLLERALMSTDGQIKLEQMGIQVKSIGTHSVRKGAGTFTAS